MKYIVYILGIAILTFGISFTIRSDIGTSPFDALLVGLSMRIGLTVGSWEIILAVILITLQRLINETKTGNCRTINSIYNRYFYRYMAIYYGQLPNT